MNDAPATNTRSRYRTILIAAAATIIVGSIAGFFIYSSICPCERTPGGLLLGERSNEAISDWSFANQVPLCQIQIWAGIRPHSINLNCMSTPEGKLYLSCSFCDGKYWSSKVGVNESGLLRLNGIVYPVTFNRVLDPEELDSAWVARIDKLQRLADPGNPAPPVGTPRAEAWWSFNLVSAI